MEDKNKDTAPVNVKAEALRLYRLQRERIKTDLEIERKLRKTLPTLSNEIRIATELLRLVHDTEEQELPAAGDGYWDGLTGFDD